MKAQHPLTLQESLSIRERILQAAIYHFSQKGYFGTSIREIAESSGVSKSTVHYYFITKSELYTSIVQMMTQECEAEVLKIAYKKENLGRGCETLTFVQQITYYFMTKPYAIGIILCCMAANQWEHNISNVMQSYFKAWLEAFIAFYENYCSPTQAKIFAEESIKQLQGSLVLGSVFTDEKIRLFQELENFIYSRTQLTPINLSQ